MVKSKVLTNLLTVQVHLMRLYYSAVIFSLALR